MQVAPWRHRNREQVDRRLSEHRSGKRRVVIIMRERGGKSLPFVCQTEDQSVPVIRARVLSGTTVYADESSSW